MNICLNETPTQRSYRFSLSKSRPELGQVVQTTPRLRRGRSGRAGGGQVRKQFIPILAFTVAAAAAAALVSARGKARSPKRGLGEQSAGDDSRRKTTEGRTDRSGPARQFLVSFSGKIQFIVKDYNSHAGDESRVNTLALSRMPNRLFTAGNTREAYEREHIMATGKWQ